MPKAKRMADLVDDETAKLRLVGVEGAQAVDQDIAGDGTGVTCREIGPPDGRAGDRPEKNTNVRDEIGTCGAAPVLDLDKFDIAIGRPIRERIADRPVGNRNSESSRG